MKDRPSEPGVPPPRPKVGIQLYTLRTQLEADPRGTLKRLVEIGFAGVETAFFAGEFCRNKAAQLLEELGQAAGHQLLLWRAALSGARRPEARSRDRGRLVGMKELQGNSGPFLDSESPAIWLHHRRRIR